MDRGAQTDIDGGDMDAFAAEGCPDVAAQLLSALGEASFEDLAAQ